MEKLVSMRIDIPQDVYLYLLAEQGKMKNEKGVGKWSLQSTLIKIIRDLKSNEKVSPS